MIQTYFFPDLDDLTSSLGVGRGAYNTSPQREACYLMLCISPESAASCVHGNKPLTSIKGGEFIDSLSDSVSRRTLPHIVSQLV
jgi:hypothetical protein